MKVDEKEEGDRWKGWLDWGAERNEKKLALQSQQSLNSVSVCRGMGEVVSW